jgi:phage terminase small subunit
MGDKFMAKKKNGLALPKDTLYDFSSMGIEGLTEREKKFIIHFTLPGESFMDAAKSARNAGYSIKTAAEIGYKTKNKPRVSAAIKKILAEKVHVDVEEYFHRSMDLIKQRAFYNLAEYMKQKTISVKIGKDEYEDREIETFKDLSELTPEQLKAIDGVDYRVNGARVLIMADRGKTITEIINMRNKLNGPVNENDYDFEATAEIIKGQLAMKVTARKRKEELAKTANFMKASGTLIQEL